LVHIFAKDQVYMIAVWYS